MKATAKKHGNDWILNGNKMWITNAGEADIFLVMANADPSKGYKGITCFVVERTFPGVSIAPKEDKVCCSHHRLDFVLVRASIAHSLPLSLSLSLYVRVSVVL
jgi:alkylation response protein AidB-like acyl-CoA dehydrogenase